MFFLTKVAILFADFWTILKMLLFEEKLPWLPIRLGNFWKIWATL